MTIAVRKYECVGSGARWDRVKRPQCCRALRSVNVPSRWCHSGGRGSKTNDEIGASCCMKILQRGKQVILRCNGGCRYGWVAQRWSCIKVAQKKCAQLACEPDDSRMKMIGFLAILSDLMVGCRPVVGDPHSLHRYRPLFGIFFQKFHPPSICAASTLPSCIIFLTPPLPPRK